MITVNIFGGIGNQMFQYALGRSLSVKLKTKLKFNYSENITRTDFKQGDIVSIFEIFKLSGEVKYYKQGPFSFKDKFINRLKNKFINFTERKNYIYEQDYSYDKNILETPNNSYLSGYWQSEKYFNNIIDILKNDFQFKIPMSSYNIDTYNKIINSNSVSLHIRGRDYLTNELAKQLFSGSNYKYYENCIEFIKKRVASPHFFIFSDDPEYAKSFFDSTDSITFVVGNSWNKTSYEDLRLMSMCKHNIITSSSFGWWGAWLNNNKGKIVLAPKMWFSDDEKNNLTVDTIPDTWIRI